MSEQNTSLSNMTAAEAKLADRIDHGVASGLTLSAGAGGLGFESAQQAMEFAKMMAVSQVAVPKHLRGNPGACLAVVIQAVEWKMSPYAVANKSYSVNDRLAYESQLIQAVILQRAPIKGRFRFSFIGEGPKRRCRVEATTTEGEIVDYETPEIDKIPVKNSPLWKGDSDQQLTYYAGRALCRRHFPDVILGVYTPEESDMMPRGPDHARDVTPASNLSGIQARLAATNAAAPIDIEAHVDREAGEITEAKDHGPADAVTGAGEAESSAADPAPDPNAGSPSLEMSFREIGRAHYHGGGALTEPPASMPKSGLPEFREGFLEASAEGEDFPGDAK